MTLPVRLELEFRPSQWLSAYLLGAFLLTGLSLAELLSGLTLILALIALSVYGGNLFRRYGRLTGKGSVTGLDLATESNCLYRKGFEDESVTLLSARRIGQRLLVIRLKQQNGAESWLPVFRDQLSAEQFRRLRVWLRFTPSPSH